MESKITKFLVWVALVFAWNFGFPEAEPLHDVIAAIVLSFIPRIKIPWGG